MASGSLYKIIPFFNISIECIISSSKAFDQIKDELLKKNIVLFQGVTSSGKTAIYMKLIKEITDNGGQVLFLLPEISITSQMVSRFNNYFAGIVQVYHSKFNLNERTEIWKSVSQAKNNARVIIGAISDLTTDQNWFVRKMFLGVENIHLQLLE